MGCLGWGYGSGRAIHLHINPFSVIALGYTVELVTEGTSSYLEYRDLAPHSKSFGQSLRDLTLTLALSVGNSYSRDKKCSAGDPSERWTTKYHSTMREQPTAVTRSRLRKGSRSEEPNHPTARSSLERALREINSRGCNSLPRRL
ncbi:hypothetical protein PIB30_092848 [Stylosanthes scabra]|uniref:Uncharacterized protein n=1 Tax=Stylosanthes scabra TaxID=79078 RepID=A0ABU6VVB8_9FABA|nr:hypothetical protein [Stylosanthes scabra]